MQFIVINHNMCVIFYETLFCGMITDVKHITVYSAVVFPIVCVTPVNVTILTSMYLFLDLLCAIKPKLEAVYHC